jgi:nucleotide-binding universal stress UspA family protein
MFEKILVCLDGSKFAEQILPYVTEEAGCFRSKIVLLQVIPEPVIVTPGIPGAAGVPIETSGMLEQMQREEKEAAAYLEYLAAALREKGLDVEMVVLQGAPGEAIISYANDNNVGLIAVATHGRGGFRRAIFGSVADYVLRTAGLPVLVIKPRDTES